MKHQKLIKLSRKSNEDDWDEDLIVVVNQEGHVLVAVPSFSCLLGSEGTFPGGEFVLVKNKRYYVVIDKKHKYFMYAKFQEDFKKCRNLYEKLLLINGNNGEVVMAA